MRDRRRSRSSWGLGLGAEGGEERIRLGEEEADEAEEEEDEEGVRVGRREESLTEGRIGGIFSFLNAALRHVIQNSEAVRRLPGLAPAVPLSVSIILTGSQGGFIRPVVEIPPGDKLKIPVTPMIGHYYSKVPGSARLNWYYQIRGRYSIERVFVNTAGPSEAARRPRDGQCGSTVRAVTVPCAPRTRLESYCPPAPARITGMSEPF
eukprot:767975-Hanusia_phi.AAC.1